MGRFRYEPSQGPAQYRRTLYAFWRRSAAPTFLFDSAQRRVCEVRPRRTNTPLHALALMNGLTQRAAARALAKDVLALPEDDRLPAMFRQVLARSPNDAELRVSARELRRGLAYYRANPADAEAVLDFGQPEQIHTDEPVELAAYMNVANMILNLDEAITRE